MPRSRRRPAAVRKRKAVARANQCRPGSQVVEFTDAPWLIWQQMYDMPAPAQALAVLEHTPFRMDFGDRITHISLAGLADMLDVDVAHLAEVAGKGFFCWDPITRMVIATVPH